MCHCLLEHFNSDSYQLKSILYGTNHHSVILCYFNACSYENGMVLRLQITNITIDLIIYQKGNRTLCKYFLCKLSLCNVTLSFYYFAHAEPTVVKTKQKINLAKERWLKIRNILDYLWVKALDLWSAVSPAPKLAV